MPFRVAANYLTYVRSIIQALPCYRIGSAIPKSLWFIPLTWHSLHGYGYDGWYIYTN